MSGELERQPMSVDGLANLGRTAESEHLLAEAAAGKALMHAMNAGEALMQAREVIPPGDWVSWIDENLSMTHRRASLYIRLAHYRHELPADEQLSIAAAQEALTGLPGVNVWGRYNSPDEQLVADARSLREQGVTYKAIAERLDVPYSSVRRWVNPTHARKSKEAALRRRKRDSAARAALKRQERDDAVKRMGGDASKAYALLRKCEAELDRAISSSGDPSERLSLKDALGFAHKAEDSIVNALNLGRQS